jgi:hypothetical protein
MLPNSLKPLIVVAIALGPNLASADARDGELDPLELNVALMDEILRESTEETIRVQRIAAITGITIGTALLGLGTWRLVETDPQNAFSRGVGVGFMVAGAANLTAGVFAATRVTHESRRMARWEEALELGIDEAELSRFEGELRASREIREGERLLLRWSSLTNAMAGAIVIGLSAIPDGSSNTDKLGGYISGAIFVVVGMSLFASTFKPLPSETAWEEYSRRRTPSTRKLASFGLVPNVSRRGGGLSFGATF